MSAFGTKNTCYFPLKGVGISVIAMEPSGYPELKQFLLVFNVSQ